MNSLRGLVSFSVTDPVTEKKLNIDSLINLNALRIWTEVAGAADLDEALEAYNRNPLAQVPRLLFAGYQNLKDAKDEAGMSFTRFAALLGTVQDLEGITSQIADAMSLDEANFPTAKAAET